MVCSRNSTCAQKHKHGNSTINLWKLGNSGQFSEVTQNEDNPMLRVLALVCNKCDELCSLDIEERGDSITIMWTKI